MNATQFEVRTGRSSGYTDVGDWVLLSPLSDRAVRIYGLLRMHCEGLHDDEAWPSQKTLADMIRVKKVDTIQEAIKELVEIGAVAVETVPTQHGRHNRYTVHLSPPPGYDRGPRDRASYYVDRKSESRGIPRNQGSPVQGDTPKSGVMGHPEIRGDGSPLPGGSEGYQGEGNQKEGKEGSKPSPTAGAARVSQPPATPPSPNRTQPAQARKPKPRHDQGQQLALLEASGPVEAVVPIHRKAEETFARFWQVYPLKKAKGDAWKAWVKAVKATDPDVIIGGVGRYVTELRASGAYTAYPATWLNGQRWLDEPDAARNARAASGDTGGVRQAFRGYDDDSIFLAPIN